MKLRNMSALATLATACLAPAFALGQTGMPAPTPSAVGSSPVLASVRIPEGTEVEITFGDTLSSGTSAEGDRFSVLSTTSIKLPNGVTIPAGYRGVGEVTVAKKKGMMGKGGELNVRLDYLKIGDSRVRLRASEGKEGSDSTGATIALTVLFGPLGLLKHGHDTEIQAGQTLRAFVDSDIDIPMPIASPPT